MVDRQMSADETHAVRVFLAPTKMRCRSNGQIIHLIEWARDGDDDALVNLYISILESCKKVTRKFS